MAWFDDVIRDVVWKAIRDTANAVGTWGEAQAEAFLAGLTPGQQLSASPLVRVLANDGSWVTVLVRGRQPLGAVSPFLRLEARVSRDVNITSSGPLSQVQIVDLVGELVVEKKGVVRGALALGYLDGAWLGRGMLALLPAGFGLDVVLGGLDSRGLMIGLDLDLPAPVPLGTSGLGLKGVGGDFAYNFVPRLESPPGTPIPAPAAKDYVAWAHGRGDIDRWRPGPLDQTAVGVGIRADLGTLPDNCFTLALEPIGLAVFVPGPVFILGGAGKLIRTESVRAEGYLAVDIPSESIALGLKANVRVPPAGPTFLLEGSGALNAFFSFRDPESWYLNLGARTDPVRVRVIRDPAPWSARAYLMLDHNRIAFGAGLAVDYSMKVWIVHLTAKAGVLVDAAVGWNPFQLQGEVALEGELGLKVWKIGLALRAWARALGTVPNPTKLAFTVGFVVDMPWPVPDIPGEAHLVIGDNPQAPALRAPLLAGTAEAPLRVGAVHPMTARQWELDGTAPIWPDTEIVLPFSHRVTDQTGTVVGQAVGSEDAGGYLVTHRLEQLALHDLVHDTPVTGVRATWAAGPGGTTARLHLLARDPFAWLSPHLNTHEGSWLSPPRFVEQRFGYGPEQAFSDPRRFVELIVDPLGSARLVDDFAPHLPTRVLRTGRFQLAVQRPDGTPVAFDRLRLVVLGARSVIEHIELGPGIKVTVDDLGIVVGELRLLELYIALPTARAKIDLDPAAQELLVYAVRYREAAATHTSTGTTTILTPGRYRLTIGGHTSATKPDPDYPDAAPVTWGLIKEFDVAHPESTRPYTKAATIGDARVFGAERDEWHPAGAGLGFPAYRSYAAAVRFNVGYLSQIFPTLAVAVISEDGPRTDENLTLTGNAQGETSALPASQNWVAEGGGAVPPDDEISGTKALPAAPGAAAVEVSVALPDGGRDVVDRWSCEISQFTSFRHHVAWTGTCVTRFYDAAGPREQAACPVIAGSQRITVGKHQRPVFGAGSAIEVSPGLLDEIVYDSPYPDEVTAAPSEWRLPAALAAEVGALDPTAAARFLRFALLSGARFSSGAGSPLQRLTDVASATTVEAVVDAQGRPLALWLRTPEPLDWRRVTAQLRIRHVEQVGVCPTAYAHRRQLELGVRFLPSPDGSSAFVVGVFAGQPIRLPRGGYQFRVSFDPARAGLVRLRPLPSVGAIPETATLSFLQPSGLDWPLPAGGTRLPPGFLDRLRERWRKELPDDWPWWEQQLFPLPAMRDPRGGE